MLPLNPHLSVCAETRPPPANQSWQGAYECVLLLGDLAQCQALNFSKDSTLLQ
jgi:hypothetical protein